MDVTFAVRLLDETLVKERALPLIDTVVSGELYPVPVKVTGVFPEPRNTEVGEILEIVGVGETAEMVKLSIPASASLPVSSVSFQRR